MARPPRKKNEHRGPGRRVPPPESTGEERRYLQGMADAGASIVVRTRDGVTIQGVIENQDGDTIQVQIEGGSLVQLRKSEIRSLHDASES